MKISDLCKSYFSGFQEASKFNDNDSKTNTLALIKILSYFTFIIPLAFAAVYGAVSLCGRVSKKQKLSFQDINVNDQAKKIYNNKLLDSSSKHADITPFLEKAKIYAEKQSFGSSGDYLLSYITKILKNPKFQTNPEKYMKYWKQKRGNTEECRIPEDLAMSFFENEVLPNI